MSKSDHAILDLGEDELQFTETDYKTESQTRNENFTEFPSPGGSHGEMDTDRLLDSEEQPRFNASFWTLGFYQQFFDVDTNDVKNRLIYSMIPIPGKSFLQHYIRPKPDLYGPIWICLTLVFSIAITGNLSDYLSSAVTDTGHNWHYDFHKVTLAATAVFSYASLLPAGLYGFLWWMGSGAGTASLTFLELLCLYGYSLAIYVPVSVLWLVQIYWLQWLLVLAGAGLSGAVLMMTVWPVIRDQATKSAGIVMVVILLLHVLLACGFMLYFFQHGSQPSTAAPTPAHNDTLAEPDIQNLNIENTHSDKSNNDEASPKHTEKIDGGEGVEESDEIDPPVQKNDKGADTTKQDKTAGKAETNKSEGADKIKDNPGDQSSKTKSEVTN